MANFSTGPTCAPPELSGDSRPAAMAPSTAFEIPTLSAPSEAQAWVDARIAEGSDYIKIVIDDFSAYGGHRPTLNKETLKAVIDAAHKRGKLAVVHIGNQQEAHDVIAAGADGLAHLFADSAPVARFRAVRRRPSRLRRAHARRTRKHQRRRQRRVTHHRSPPRPYLTTDDIASLKRSFPKFATAPSEKYAEQTVAQLKATHVPILAGTDAPNPGTSHGASIHRELELLVRSGLTPAEALAAATSGPGGNFSSRRPRHDRSRKAGRPSARERRPHAGHHRHARHNFRLEVGRRRRPRNLSRLNRKNKTGCCCRGKGRAATPTPP